MVQSYAEKLKTTGFRGENDENQLEIKAKKQNNISSVNRRNGVFCVYGIRFVRCST